MKKGIQHRCVKMSLMQATPGLSNTIQHSLQKFLKWYQAGRTRYKFVLQPERNLHDSPINTGSTERGIGNYLLTVGGQGKPSSLELD